MYKLRILPLILLSITMSSCSSSGQDDPITPEPDNPDTPKPTPELVSISFGGNSGAWQDAPNTRTGKSGLETLFPSFRVWGYKSTDTNAASYQLVMNGYNVQYINGSASTSTSNSDDWEYVGIENEELSSAQTIKYWDYSATSYRFFGYSPSDAKVDITSNTTANTENTESNTNNLSISFPFAYSDTATYKDFPYISELWFHNDSQQYGKNVTLTFAPLIAKVRFKFSYPDGTTSIKIENIRLQDSRFIDETASDDAPTPDTPLKGNIHVAYPQNGTPNSKTPSFSWTDSQDEDAKGALIFTIPYEDKDTPLHILEESQYGKWYYVPPLGISSYAQGAYTITARIDGNNTSATVPAAYMQWLPGYQYTYIFKITEAGTNISFANLEVEQWIAGKNTDNNGTGTEGW